MDYALARQLKDAGFPQDNRNDTVTFLQHTNLDTVKVPGLTELIEACGDCYSFILKFCKACGEDRKPIWHAVLQEGDFPDHDWVSAATPTEAVAKLWLELHKV
jgi:hypothetical protein